MQRQEQRELPTTLQAAGASSKSTALGVLADSKGYERLSCAGGRAGYCSWLNSTCPVTACPFCSFCCRMDTVASRFWHSGISHRVSVHPGAYGHNAWAPKLWRSLSVSIAGTVALVACSFLKSIKTEVLYSRAQVGFWHSNFFLLLWKSVQLWRWTGQAAGTQGRLDWPVLIHQLGRSPVIASASCSRDSASASLSF